MQELHPQDRRARRVGLPLLGGRPPRSIGFSPPFRRESTISVGVTNIVYPGPRETDRFASPARPSLRSKRKGSRPSLQDASLGCFTGGRRLRPRPLSRPQELPTSTRPPATDRSGSSLHRVLRSHTESSGAMAAHAPASRKASAVHPSTETPCSWLLREGCSPCWIAIRRDRPTVPAGSLAQPSDLVTERLREPEVSVGASHHSEGLRGRRGDRELGDHPCGGDARESVAASSENHTIPSGPIAVADGRPLSEKGSGNSVIAPEVVIRPILLAVNSVNQRCPSGAAMGNWGPLPALGSGNCVSTPSNVMRPTTSLDVVYRKVSVRAEGYTGDPGAGGYRDREFGDCARNGDACQPGGVLLCKPDVAVRCRDRAEHPAVGIGYGVFRDDSLGSDGSHSTGELLSEPEPPVGTDGDRNRRATPRQQWELRDRTTGRHPANLAHAVFSEPDVAVRPRHDPKRVTCGGRRRELVINGPRRAGRRGPRCLRAVCGRGHPPRC